MKSGAPLMRRPFMLLIHFFLIVHRKIDAIPECLW